MDGKNGFIKKGLKVTNVISDKLFFNEYSLRLQNVLANSDWSPVVQLAEDLQSCLKENRRLFICGNGGSAGNAIHLANDFLYGIAKRSGGGLKVLSLSDNPAVITCLANDLGYDQIFSEQLAVQGEKDDLLIVLSGSGNSPNIIRAINQAKKMNIKSYAILGFDGGQCKSLADVAIHFSVNDMQIAEDMQIVVGHMIMQWLYMNRPK
jgi:D-sedoheptulose 7-phosphate isomerase